MEAGLRQVRHIQLVVGHSIALSKQYPPIADNEHRAGEVACLGERAEIRMKALGDLVVPGGLTERNRLEQNHTCNRQNDRESFHSTSRFEHPSRTTLKWHRTCDH